VRGARARGRALRTLLLQCVRTVRVRAGMLLTACYCCSTVRWQMSYGYCAWPTAAYCLLAAYDEPTSAPLTASAASLLSH
jgi:hypothetical protein